MQPIKCVPLFISSLLLSTNIHADIIYGTGAQASSSIYASCPSFCQNPVFDSAGGDGFSTASSSLNNTSGESKSMATLSGTTYTPILKAYGEAFGSGGGFASATGVQGYTYNGIAPTTITLDLILDGDLDISAGGSAEASISGQVAVIFTNQLDFYTDFGTVVFEVAPPGSVAAQSQMFGNGTDQLSFDVNPGDDFFVWAGLQVGGERGGIADAYHTFTMGFDDDTGLTAADVSAVPVPAAAWLFLSGFGLLAGIARKR